MVSTLTDAGYRVIIYSMRSDAATILDCIDNGAVTYLTKSEGRQHLVPAIEAAVTDHPYVSPSMAGAMSADTRASRPSLSEREREVLIQWFRTESKTFAAKALYITASTVNTHLGARTHQIRRGRPAGVDESSTRRPRFAGRNHQHRRPLARTISAGGCPARSCVTVGEEASSLGDSPSESCCELRTRKLCDADCFFICLQACTSID